MPAENSSIFRVATAYEANKRTRTVEPDAAEATRELGRARFYDALAGRYGLAGATLADPFGTGSQENVSDLPFAQRYDLSKMTVDEVLELAEELRAIRGMPSEEADLLSYRFGGLPFAADTVFSSSPVAEFARILEGSRGAMRTVDLIEQQEEQLRYLTDNDADPRAIRGARNVLAQLRQLQVEQGLYAQIDASRERFDVRAGGFGPFGTGVDLLSLPPSAVALFATA